MISMLVSGEVYLPIVMMMMMMMVVMVVMVMMKIIMMMLTPGYDECGQKSDQSLYEAH